MTEIVQVVLKLLQSKIETENPHRSQKLSFSDFELHIVAENDLTVDR